MQLIPLTNVCNQKCVFCSAEGREDDVTSEKIFKEIDSQIQNRAKNIVLSGGETTLAPEIFKILKYLRERNIPVELQTNALTSSKNEVAKALVLSGVSLFNVNFPSHLPEINDVLTGTKNTLPTREDGVKNLIALGADVRLTHIVSSLNYEYLPDFIKYVNSNFERIKYIQFSFLKGMGGVLKHLDLLPDYDKVSPYLIKAFDLCKKFKISAVADHIPPCFLGKYYQQSIDYIKVVNRGDLKISKSEKKHVSECKKCLLKSYCLGPRKEYVKYKKGSICVKPVTKLL